MDLFESFADPSVNLLPFEGEVYYYGKVIPEEMADSYLADLLSHVCWQSDKAIILGKEITTKRKVAWYGEKPFQYTYSKTTKTALPFNSVLLTLKELVEIKSEETYNSCLANLYHSGHGSKIGVFTGHET